jgi:uncharacterized protein
MGLLEQLQSDLKDAMRARDTTRMTTIRSLRAAITNEEVNRRSRIRSQALQRLAQERGVKPEEIGTDELPSVEPLSEPDMLQVLRSEIKKRQESAEAYRGGGRVDAAAQEEAEIAVLQQYLPRQLGADELRPLVAEIIGEVGASGKSDMKKVMPVVMSRYRDVADGRTLNQLVQELLG